MARNGSGAYSLPSGNPVVTGTVISSTWANTTLSDIGTALTNSIAKDGQTTPTANLPMGGYKHTGLGAGSAAGDSLRYEQLFNSGTLSLPGNLTVSGSINTARGSVAMHATTMDLWAQPNIIDGTGSAVTITDIADAPQAGAIRILYPIAATVITDGATFDVDGGANYTTAAGDALIFEAVTTSTFKVHIVKADGTAVVAASTQIQAISASVGSNALTISASALTLDFRSTTLGSGTVTRVSGTPSNLVISSGSTLGTANSAPSRIAVLAINNAGTIELAVKNCSSGDVFDESALISTTAEGGAGGADSASVAYSTTARTNVAFRVIGFIDSTQTTAGTWATAPTKIQGFGGNAKLTSNVLSGVAQATTSGTAIDFTGIPPWVKRITLMFNDVSTNGTFSWLIQIGTAAGLQTSGYNSSSTFTGASTGGISSGSGFIQYYDNAARTITGAITLALLDSSNGTWIASGVTIPTDVANLSFQNAGKKILSGVLDRVRLTTAGSDTFDNGSINILYE